MGKRGPKAAREDGCHVTRKGYLRGRFDGRLRLAHVVVWERARGQVPPGMQVHHVNEDKGDNRIENLALVSPTVHKRIHGGCELRDGVWWKPCSVCRAMKPIDVGHWYISKEGWPLYGRCRLCHIRIVCEKSRERRPTFTEGPTPGDVRKVPRPAKAAQKAKPGQGDLFTAVDE